MARNRPAAAGGAPAPAQDSPAPAASEAAPAPPAGLVELPPAAAPLWECSLAHSPRLRLGAADADAARAEYLRRCNVLATDNPVAVQEVPRDA